MGEWAGEGEERVACQNPAGTGGEGERRGVEGLHHSANLRRSTSRRGKVTISNSVVSALLRSSDGSSGGPLLKMAWAVPTPPFEHAPYSHPRTAPKPCPPPPPC